MVTDNLQSFCSEIAIFYYSGNCLDDTALGVTLHAGLDPSQLGYVVAC